MKASGTASILVVMALALPAWSQSFLPGHVGADAQWVVHLDAGKLLQSAVGKQMSSHLDQSEKGLQNLKEFQQKFKVDPRKDVTGVTFYGKKAAAENANDLNINATVIVYGKFDPASLTGVVKGMNGYREHKHGATAIHQWQATDAKKTVAEPGNPMAGMFAQSKASDGFAAFSANTIVMGDTADAVKNALDVMGRKKEPLSDPKLLQALKTVQSHAMLFGAANMAPMKTADGPQLEGLQFALAETGGNLNFGMSLTAPNAETAQQLHAQIEGFKGMMTMMQAENPEALKALQGLKIVLQGSVIRTEYKLPVADAIKHVDKL